MAGQDSAGFRVFCARSLAPRAEAMRRQIAPVRRAEDVEAVHQMRVASRRLRAALSLFRPAIPEGDRRRWRRVVRRVTRALGPARDRDVQIELVAAVTADLADDERRRALPGLQRLGLRLRQARADQARRIEKTIDRLEASDVLGQMGRFAREALAAARLDRVEPGGPFALAHARHIVRRRLQALLAYEPFVERPEHAEPLHEMRIAAKRLRYSLEVFEPLYAKGPEGLKPHIATVKRVQGLLGDLHDCDVWALELPRFGCEEAQRTRRFFGHTRGFARLRPGLELLAANRRRCRAAVYEQFVAHWRGHAGVWDGLLELVDGPGEETTDAGGVPVLLSVAPPRTRPASDATT